jgi:uncharacterized protein involved in exopolysaccharide biosynthesis
MIKDKNKQKLKSFIDPSEEYISFYDILLTLSKYSKIIIIVPILFSIVTIFYVTFFADSKYLSTSKIVSNNSNTLSQAAGIAARFGIPIPSISQQDQKWVYPEVIRSRTLAKSILKRKFKSKKFKSEKSLLNILMTQKEFSLLDEKSLEIIAVNKFLKMINISEDIKTAILTLGVISNEPLLSAEINRVIIEELDLHQQRFNKDKMSKAKLFIEERIYSVEKELIMAEESLKVFMDRNRRIENSPALQLERQRLEREVTVLIGVFTTLKQQLETTKIEEVKKSSYILILDPPEIPLVRSSPQKKLMVVLGFIFGFTITVFFIIINEKFIFSKKEDKKKIEKAKFIFIKNLKDLLKIKNT